MTLTTRHGAAFGPRLFGVEQNVVSGTYTDTPLIQGTYINYVMRQFSSGYNQYTISALADSFENLTPAILDASNFPVIDRVSSGVGTLRLLRNKSSIDVDFDLRDLSQVYAPKQRAISVVSGTIYERYYVLMKDLVLASGKSSSLFRDKNTLSPLVLGSGTSTHSSIEKNPTCWAADYDFSGVAFYNSDSNAPNKGGTLITGKHLVEAEHYSSPIGTTWKFIKADGTVVSATSIGQYSAPIGANSYIPNTVALTFFDTTVHVLDIDLQAEGITPYKVIGDWFHRSEEVIASRPDINQITILAVSPYYYIWIDQNRQVYAGGTFKDEGNSSYRTISPYVVDNVEVPILRADVAFAAPNVTPGDPTFINELNASGRFTLARGGDSGGPFFMPDFSGGLILCGCFTLPGGGGSALGPKYNAMISLADADAVARGNLVSSTGLTVTVAPDPTL